MDSIINELDLIGRSQCELILNSSRVSFEQFCELHDLRPLPIRGAGVVYRRSEFVAAVKRAMEKPQ